MNKVILSGRLGRNPETRTLDSGQTVTSVSLCTTRKYKNKAGELVDDNQWHNLTCWGISGQALAQHNQKGDSIIIEGELRTRSYEKNGVTHYATDVNVSQWYYGQRKREFSEVDAPPPRNVFSSAMGGITTGENDPPF